MRKTVSSKTDQKLYKYIDNRAEGVSKEVCEIILSSPVDEGGVIFLNGPVYSGKSLIVCLLEKCLKQKRKVVCGQPAVDRPDVLKGEIFCRTGLKCAAVSYSNKMEIQKLFNEHDVVIIDEVQFTPFDLQSYLLDEIDEFVDRGGWLVSAGLLLTSQQTEFLLSSLISQRSVKTYSLTSTCQMCGRKGAAYNQRLVNGKSPGRDDQDLLPPSDVVTYESRCKDCLVRV